MWWHTVKHGRGTEGGNWRMEWVASTLHTTSEHGVSSITTADAHTSAASSRLNWRPRRFKWTRPFHRKTKSGFCACAITFQTQSTRVYLTVLWPCISICKEITYWGWCRIESHSLQYNMFIVHRAREVHFIYCTRLYWLECHCLLIESGCHVLCRLGSLLSAKSNRKCLPLLRYWTHQINCHTCVAPRKA